MGGGKARWRWEEAMIGWREGKVEVVRKEVEVEGGNDWEGDYCALLHHA